VDAGNSTIPVYRATDWEPYEISIVPMGADAGALVRSQETPMSEPGLEGQEFRQAAADALLLRSGEADGLR
jgi:hypothetical protein